MHPSFLLESGALFSAQTQIVTVETYQDEKNLKKK